MQVSLLTESGGTKDDLKLPTDETLLTQVRALYICMLALGYVCEWGCVCFSGSV